MIMTPPPDQLEARRVGDFAQALVARSIWRAILAIVRWAELASPPRFDHFRVVTGRMCLSAQPREHIRSDLQLCRWTSLAPRVALVNRSRTHIVFSAPDAHALNTAMCAFGKYDFDARPPVTLARTVISQLGNAIKHRLENLVDFDPAAAGKQACRQRGAIAPADARIVATSGRRRDA